MSIFVTLVLVAQRNRLPVKNLGDKAYADVEYSEEYIKGRSAPFADSVAAEDSVGLLAQRPSYEAKKRTEILREEKHGIESLPPVPDSSDDEQ